MKGVEIANSQVRMPMRVTRTVPRGSEVTICELIVTAFLLLRCDTDSHMSSKPQHAKRPSGARPLVRRLFSKDEVTSVGAKLGEETETNSSGSSTLPQIAELSEDQSWLGKGVIMSPVLSGESSPRESNSSVSSPESSSPPVRAPLANVAVEARENDMKHAISSPNSSPDPTIGPRLRWQQVRQHMLSGSQASTISRPSSPASSFTSFSQLGLPRTPTPKPSRFPRLGFRHIVDNAREVADDVSSKFSEDMQTLCWAVRFGTIRPAKPEREATAASLASTLHLPGLSSTSLPLTPNVSTVSLSATIQTRPGFRRPGSVSSSALSSQSTNLSLLQIVISTNAAKAATRTSSISTLPNERELLSVLLLLLLSIRADKFADDDRKTVLDIFQIIIRTWKAHSAEVSTPNSYLDSR